MAKFKIESTSGMPMMGAQYEADYMKQDKQYVQLYKRVAGGTDELVVAVHLDKGTALVKQEPESKGFTAPRPEDTIKRLHNATTKRDK